MGRPIHLLPLSTKEINCVSYTPFRGTQTPFDPNFIVPITQIENDFHLLSSYTKCVRIYATDQGLDQILPVAQKYNIKILLGIWIGREDKANQKQITHALTLTKNYPTSIKAIIVGNEVILRGELSPQKLNDFILQVKKSTTLPVTYADVWEFWLHYPELVKYVDFITIHILPYWEDKPISVQHSLQHIDAILNKMHEVFPNHKIFIGETGWPSFGRIRQQAIPSPINQSLYLRQFLEAADQRKWDYNLIEAFDQPWKRTLEGTVGGYWGLFTEDRLPRFTFSEPISNYNKWQNYFFASFIISGILLFIFLNKILTLTSHKTSHFIRYSLYIMGIIQCLGISLVFQYHDLLIRSWTLGQTSLYIVYFILNIILAISLIKITFGPACFSYDMLLFLKKDKRKKSIIISYDTIFQIAHFAVCLLFIINTLLLVFDPRYRDFPLSSFWFSGLISFLYPLLEHSEKKYSLAPRQKSALFILVLILCPFIIFQEKFINHETWQWFIIGLILFSDKIRYTQFFDRALNKFQKR
ncbi:MAG: hypothetical protein K1X44_03775 [Alphaproteobacteria bacterium]|nr:hypothetical protein [Alphaproteobacteria bacterium]